MKPHQSLRGLDSEAQPGVERDGTHAIDHAAGDKSEQRALSEKTA